MSQAWMIYGANGYTGRLIAKEAVRRGMQPTLAGRDPGRIEPLAAGLGCPHRAFALDDRGILAQRLEGMQLVLHCAGPFSATARPMIDACVAAGVHYLDITGEIPVIEQAAARDSEAKAAGVTLLPAVGFDVVPSDCLAAMLAQRLPGAELLQLAFAGLLAVSPGTAKTMLEGLPSGGRVRQQGKIVAVPPAWKTLDVPFHEGVQSATTIPWGDVASAWYSTGIPNIEVYMGMPAAQIRWLRRLRPLVPLLRSSLVQRVLRGVITRLVAGPSAEHRRRARSSFWGRVQHAEGSRAEATLQTADGYTLTVLTALACVQRVLTGGAASGFLTPSRAFGADFILTIPGTEMQWTA